MDSQGEATDEHRIPAAEFEAAIRKGEVVDFSGKTIEGPVNLNAADYPHKLVIKGAKFTGHFDASEARFAKTLDLTGCTFEQGLTFASARIDGHLILNSASILGGEFGRENAEFELCCIEGNLCARELQTELGLNLRACRVIGDAEFFGARILGDLMFARSKISGNLWARPQGGKRVLIGGMASLIGTRVGGQVGFGGAEVCGDLNLQSADLGALFYKPEGGHRAEIGGRAWLRGATIGGPVDFGGAKIHGDLDLQHADVATLFCRPEGSHRTEIGGKASLRTAKVGGPVELSGAKVEGDLDLQGAEVVSLLCQTISGHRTEIDGKAWLIGAKVGGPVVFSGTEIGSDLILQDAEVGALICRPEGGHRTSIGGKSSLQGAKVGAQVDFSGAEMHGDLDLQAAEVDGTLFCRPNGEYRVEIGGRVWMSVARIKGNVEFLGTRVAGDLILAGAHVGGSLYCMDAEDKRCELGGSVDFQRAVVGRFVLQGDACKDGELSLVQAQFHQLVIEGGLPRRVNVEGVKFQQMVLPDDDYVQFLDCSTSFQKSTYHRMERWLRDQGLDAKADQVYRHMRRKDRDIDQKQRTGGWVVLKPLDWVQRKLNWLLLDKLTGYGTETHRLGWGLVGSILVAACLFSSPSAIEHSYVATVNDIAAGKPKSFQSWNPKPDEWTPAHATWLAIRMHMPLFPIMSPTDYTPSSGWIPILGTRHIPGFTYENYAAFISTLSLVAVPLFLAGISGLIKRQE